MRTRAGTDIRIAIDGRIGNACPGCVLGPGDLGSPPDIEANVSPLENGSTAWWWWMAPFLVRKLGFCASR